MVRFFAVITAFLLMLSSALPVSGEAQAKLNIVVTTFPLYDWMRNILGDREKQADLTLLQDSGVDLHNYQPTAEDFVKLSEADLFVYVGGESDHWVAEAIKSVQNRRMVSVSLIDVLGSLVKNEVVIEGMQEDAHDHDDDHEGEDHGDDEDSHDHEDEGHNDDHEGEDHGADEDSHDHEDEDHDHDHDHEHDVADEHVWLSLRNTQTAVSFLKDMLAALDEANASAYEQNAQSYMDSLRELDALYASIIGQTKDPVLLFADRFPFRYLMDDYGIAYYAAFSGCSAETEASFATITFLAGKLDELKLDAVITIDGSDQRIAGAVIGASMEKGQKVLRLDSMQSVTWADIEEGAGYISIMRDNLDIIAQALEQ